ncbi:MAG: hypothetical protein AAF708_19440, partial [Deinococcota bacterium]
VVDIPSEVNLPEYVDESFADFYVSMFDTLADRAQYESGVVFLEHAWDMRWCDPCAANPLNDTELRQAGVFWNVVGVRSVPTPSPRVISNAPNTPVPVPTIQPTVTTTTRSNTPPNVYLTRLHLRYDRESHPEDLRFRVTDNRENFQGRYILQRPFNGIITCEEGEVYVQEVLERQQREAQQLADLTSWELTEIQANITPYDPEIDIRDWWDSVFDSFEPSM